MRPFAHRTPRQLRSLSLQLVSLPGAAFLLVLALSADFTPDWVQFVVLLGVAAGVAVWVIARYTRLATGRFTIGVITSTMALTTLIGLTIQPAAIGTLSAFVFLGIAVAASAFLHQRMIVAFSVACTVLGVLMIVLRSSIPLVAGIIFVALMTITILVVLVLRQSLQAARDEAVALSLADALTGLANRRSMELNVPMMSALAERTNQHLGCLALDLDHFKMVNDTYGHLVGDDVLKVIADALIKATRNSDLCVRVGGDEFSVFTIVQGRDELSAVAERVRAAVAELAVQPPTTVSIGGALQRRGTGPAGRAAAGGAASTEGAAAPQFSPLDTLVLEADRALYEAKSAGRNAVQIAG
ncbi:GGDEF domain-containing protein [Subtercola sp. YIM 133946]|uniref:GGDEF domain-containing protein n=1 Tax=Subtercola sp. YIM 133946 TaxID=3118909 RepID=UPI002F943305